MWLATKCGRGNPSPTIWVNLYCTSLIVLVFRLGKNPFGVASLRLDWSCVLACINNKYCTTVSRMVKLWHKSGQFGGKKHLFGWKSGFFQKVVDFLLFI